MSEHYFSAEPSGDGTRRAVAARIAGEDYRFLTAGGTFSAGQLDPGTSVLLERGPDPAGRTLLDLGCGWGAIAVSLARRVPAATVWAVDVNSRALELTAANAAAAGLADRVRAVHPDDVPAEVVFDAIWSNPPIRIGKADLHPLLLRWLPRLAPGGDAWLVVARNLGADSLARWLAERGFPGTRYASAKGFRVLRVPAPPQGAPAGGAGG